MKPDISTDPVKIQKEFEELQAARAAELQKFHEIPAIYEDVEEEEIMLPMSDGVCLKTWVIRPKTDKPLPVLMQRNPYVMQLPMIRKNMYEFARHGFGGVLQSCRGTGDSEGQWNPNVNERSDGLDTMNWLADQDWVESIGYYGASYLSLTGWSMIDAVPEKVKGMYLSVYGTDRHTSAYNDGLFRQDILTSWALGNAGKEVTADPYESYVYMPQTRVDRDMWDADLPWYRDWITHTDRSDAYWQSGFWAQLKEMPKKFRIPIVLEEGWYDHHLGSSLSGYRYMTPENQARTLVRIGAWKHMSQPALEDRDCPNLQNDSIMPIYEFFKTLLIDKQEPQAGVLLYQINEDKWNLTEEWPRPEGVKDLYLDGASRTLTEEPAEASSVTYTYDPQDPVISYGSESCLHSMSIIGSLKQPASDYREDVISFVSQPVEEDIRMIGRINADLYVKSDAEDTAFSIKVMEIFPDGNAYNIRSGITTLGYRNHSQARQTYTPGQVVKINIDTWDIAWTVKKGSRIRVDISSSDFPQYNIHSNYPGIWSEQTKTKCAQQTVLSGAGSPSVLHIPFVR